MQKKNIIANDYDIVHYCFQNYYFILIFVCLSKSSLIIIKVKIIIDKYEKKITEPHFFSLGYSSPPILDALESSNRFKL